MATVETMAPMKTSQNNHCHGEYSFTAYLSHLISLAHFNMVKSNQELDFAIPTNSEAVWEESVDKDSQSRAYITKKRSLRGVRAETSRHAHRGRDNAREGGPEERTMEWKQLPTFPSLSTVTNSKTLEQQEAL